MINYALRLQLLRFTAMLHRNGELLVAPSIDMLDLLIQADLMDERNFQFSTQELLDNHLIEYLQCFTWRITFRGIMVLISARWIDAPLNSTYDHRHLLYWTDQYKLHLWRREKQDGVHRVNDRLVAAIGWESYMLWSVAMHPEAPVDATLCTVTLPDHTNEYRYVVTELPRITANTDLGGLRTSTSMPVVKKAAWERVQGHILAYAPEINTIFKAVYK